LVGCEGAYPRGAAVAAWLVLGGCTLLAPMDDLAGEPRGHDPVDASFDDGAGGVDGDVGEGGVQDSSGTGEDGESDASVCGTCNELEDCWNGVLCVAKSVKVTGGYAMDATEVTRGQYMAWLALSPPTSSLPGRCSWNDSYAPGAGTACQSASDPSKPNVPVNCVDWCDAKAYCEYVGKHLCGRIGGGAVPMEQDQLADPSLSAWYNACSSGGLYDYPYGDEWVEGACNVGSPQDATTLPVESFDTCTSAVPGFEGVYQLVGNVAEWEDACDDSHVAPLAAQDKCAVRGGYWASEPLTATCSRAIWVARSPNTSDGRMVGFRCCSDVGD